MTPTEAIAELNRDIWHPFSAAYAALDIEAFRAIHAPDLVRVQVGSGWIGRRDEYIADAAPRFAKAQALGDQFHISSGSATASSVRRWPTSAACSR